MKYSIYDIDAIRVYVVKSQNLPSMGYSYTDESRFRWESTYHVVLEEKVRTTMSDGIEISEIKEWLLNYLKEKEIEKDKEVAAQKLRLTDKKVISWEECSYTWCNDKEEIVDKDTDVQDFINTKKRRNIKIKNVSDNNPNNMIQNSILWIEKHYNDEKSEIDKVLSKI